MQLVIPAIDAYAKQSLLHTEIERLALELGRFVARTGRIENHSQSIINKIQDYENQLNLIYAADIAANKSFEPFALPSWHADSAPPLSAPHIKLMGEDANGERKRGGNGSHAY